MPVSPTNAEHLTPVLALPLASLEGQALSLLRTLAQYRRPGEFNHDLMPGAWAQARALRAMGHLLTSWHGVSWTSLLTEARCRLRVLLGEGLSVHNYLYAETLSLVLRLRRSPVDLRLAEAELGGQLVQLALGLEVLLVLGSPDGPPTDEVPAAPPLSVRDGWHLEAARALAALEYRRTLPLAQRVTGSDLQHLTWGFRGWLAGAVHLRGDQMDTVLRGARLALDSRRRPEEPSGLGAVGESLLAARLGVPGSEDALIQDGALILALEETASHLIHRQVTGAGER